MTAIVWWKHPVRAFHRRLQLTFQWRVGLWPILRRFDPKDGS